MLVDMVMLVAMMVTTVMGLVLKNVAMMMTQMRCHDNELFLMTVYTCLKKGQASKKRDIKISSKFSNVMETWLISARQGSSYESPSLLSHFLSL